MDLLSVSAKEYVPAIREAAANVLRSMGYKQTRVAELLGVTQPGVHKYLRSRKWAGRLLRIGFYPREGMLVVIEYAKLTLSSAKDANRLAYGAWLDLVLSGGLCKALGIGGCGELASVMYPGEDPVRTSVLAFLRRGYRVLRLCPGFHRLVPEVRTNLAMALPDASSEEDVAGFPGRISVARNTVYAPHSPEWGGSSHLARVLVEALRHGRYRAVLNMRYNREVERALETLGIEVEYVESSRFPGSGDPAFDALRSLFRKKGVPRVAVDLGGYGIEPNTYVFGLDAAEAADYAAAITLEAVGVGDSYLRPFLTALQNASQ